MGWLSNIFGSSASKALRLAVLKDIQTRFLIFKALLDEHNRALKSISRLEVKLQNSEQVNIQLLRSELADIQGGIGDIIDRMIELGGEKYHPLRARFTEILSDLENLFPAVRPAPKDEFIIPFDRLGRERDFSVGGKSANLGEMKSRLGLPVPDGFAISAWGYKHFIDANNLQERITRLLSQIRIRRYSDLEIVSEEIQELVTTRSVPDDLADAILAAFDNLASNHPGARFALRSSAIGEDSSLTFAGQYITFLNLHRDSLIDKYKRILASKFTPAAIYYLFRHSLGELDLAMGAVCMELVDVAASGVIYSKDPTNPDGGYVLVNSIFGFGSYLVEGILTPDVFHVARDGFKIVYSRIERKQVKLAALDDGVAEEAIPDDEQDKPSVTDEQLRELAEYALKIEAHYGEPQDIEWAIDKAGRVYLLQTRPLMVTTPSPVSPITEEMRSKILIDNGVTICPGAASGPAYHISSLAELGNVPNGVILIAPNPSPALVAVMHQINGLVTLVGGAASHLATLTRELSLPTLVGGAKAAGIAQGQEITIDAGAGAIYDGAFPEWISTKKGGAAKSEAAALDEPLASIVERIIHLEAIRPTDPNFTMENCRSLHDIARFIHQKSMEEMFSAFRNTSHKEHIGVRLKTKIPLLINIIYLDQDHVNTQNKNWVTEDSLDSLPMKALWDGITMEGWPTRPVQSDLKGFLAVVGSNIQEGHLPEFSEDSYAFLSRDYTLLSLRMGYHFQTIEAMATNEPGKNYIRMQFKLGGAPMERRVRRIWLICELLRLMGFENSNQGDFLDAVLAYQNQAAILERMKLLGRITILTKQLDIALKSDDMARWYANEFVRRLGLAGEEK